MADKIGRPGRAQDGVDVYAAKTRAGAIGVQCKRLDDLDANNNLLPGGPIDRKLLRSEADKALAFRPKLDVWVLATTAKRDVGYSAKPDCLTRNIGRQAASRYSSGFGTTTLRGSTPIPISSSDTMTRSLASGMRATRTA
jgi:hypothetical protein